MKLAAVIALLAIPPAFGQDDHAHAHGAPGALGTVHFEVS